MSRPARSTSVFDPTGVPVATYSSTTRARISSCRGLRRSSCASGIILKCTFCRAFGHELGGDPSPEEAAPSREDEPAGAALRQAEPLHPHEGVDVDGAFDLRERNGLVESQAEHQPLALRDLRLQLLLVPRRPPPLRQRPEVARQARPVPTADALDGRDRPDPDADVVLPVPVAEVVARFPTGPAEV